MRYYHFPLDHVSPVKAFGAFANDPYAIFLDSSDHDHELSHCSYICAFPVETIESHDHKVLITNKDQQLTLTGDPFDILRSRLDIWAPDADIAEQHIHGMHPFTGGAVGYFGYDMGRVLEQLPVRTQRVENIPDMAVGIYRSVLAFNHHTKKNILYVLAPDESRAEAQAGLIFKKLKAAKNDTHVNPFVNLKPAQSKDAFKAKIEKIIDYIFAGDIFQANLSLRFQASKPDDFEPYTHYKTMRDLNKAPFSAFMNFDNFQVSSVSPERFLYARKGDVETRPIKGTVARQDDPGANKHVIEALSRDEKCRAENAMIVDLLRNDLSKVCTDYSVDVPSLCHVETYAKVNHMVSTVTGKLRPDHHVIDLLKSCFPGGSITGAPKIRAMEIIEELEESRRGPYCGAIGYIGFDNAMDSNLAIRTIIHTDNSIMMNVGNGIVADSDPELEYEELMAKAKGLLDSFEITQNNNHQDLQDDMGMVGT